jgi:hypothetical protein
LVNMGIGTELNFSTIPDGTLTDRSFSIGYGFNFLSTAELTVYYYNTYQQLTEPFNPIDDEKYTEFNAGEEYSWNGAGVELSSDQRKLFYYELEARYGGFYNGNNFNLTGELNYRYQPYGSVAVRFDYNDVRLASGYGKEKLMLIGPRIDMTFTDKIFLTTFVQYNNLQDNVNLNARFQWRYKPASDFFVVYTENYLPENLRSKNRALVFKFTYWLNL